jgi:hypothetical protein
MRFTARFLFIFAALLALASCAGRNEPPEKIQKLIYPGATNVTSNPAGDGSGWQLIYDVTAPYPPIKVLDFLRKNMRDANNFPNKLGEKGFWSWVEQLDTSKKEEAYVRQYMAPWSTLAGRETALVTLQYSRLADKDWDDKLRVYIIVR